MTRILELLWWKLAFSLLMTLQLFLFVAEPSNFSPDVYRAVRAKKSGRPQGRPSLKFDKKSVITFNMCQLPW